MDILGLIDIPLWLILFLGALVLLYVYGTWNYTLWVSQGVAGPKPRFLTGNLLEIQEKGHFRVYKEWQQKYGRVVGYFTGVRPTLVVTDLDMVREVMVKQFGNFIDRNMVPGMRQRNIEKALFFAGTDIWKRIRSLMTPAFSTSKLKLMSHYVNRCVDLLVKSVDNKARADQVIDVKDLYGAFTLDVIAGTAFGLETNSQTQAEEPFIQHCKKFFSFTGNRMMKYILLFGNMFPFMAFVMRNFGILANNSQFFFAALEAMVDERRQSSHGRTKKTSDLLQMLVEAEEDTEGTGDDPADVADQTPASKRMTKEEVVAQGFIVLIAGYETTSTTLQYLTYNLVMNPHVQDRVFQEIRDTLGDDKPTYENVSQLKYLEATIRETLRTFPPVALVDRRALKPTTINGIDIPAGCGVTIPIQCILHDPEYFPQPDVFNPDRFLEENVSQIHPVTVDLPFGYGPRKCIGMRLALLEVKMAAVQVLRHFRFVKCAETPDTINMAKAFTLSMPDTVIKVKAEIRGD